MGTGYHWIMPFAHGPHDVPIDFDYEHAIPVFADYVRYFPFTRHPRNAFFLGMEGGAAFYLKARPENTRHPNDIMAPYLNGKLGFDFGIGNRFGINVGLNLIWGLGHGVGLSSEGGPPEGCLTAPCYDGALTSGPRPVHGTPSSRQRRQNN